MRIFDKKTGNIKINFYGEPIEEQIEKNKVLDIKTSVTYSFEPILDINWMFAIHFFHYFYFCFSLLNKFMSAVALEATLYNIIDPKYKKEEYMWFIPSDEYPDKKDSFLDKGPSPLLKLSELSLSSKAGPKMIDDLQEREKCKLVYSSIIDKLSINIIKEYDDHIKTYEATFFKKSKPKVRYSKGYEYYYAFFSVFAFLEYIKINVSNEDLLEVYKKLRQRMYLWGKGARIL